MSLIPPAIHTLVPHAGAMCLLERIVSAGERDIVCATRGHTAKDNPLRRGNRLAALHLAEYGAQTMAIHGGLQDPAAAQRGGMLVAIRDLQLAVDHLDDIDAELTIAATRLVANPDGQIYSFVAHAAGRELGRGRVSVMFAAAQG